MTLFLGSTTTKTTTTTTKEQIIELITGGRNSTVEYSSIGRCQSISVQNNKINTTLNIVFRIVSNSPNSLKISTYCEDGRIGIISPLPSRQLHKALLISLILHTKVYESR